MIITLFLLHAINPLNPQDNHIISSSSYVTPQLPILQLIRYGSYNSILPCFICPINAPAPIDSKELFLQGGIKHH